jgi:hypothetical protein
MQAMQGDPLQRWGVRSVAPLTEAELEKYAEYQYPIYACGYNWLESCGESAKRLERRIENIIAWWKTRKHECNQVILVTHSMGGLVARACAKRIPDKVLGVIHGVMPALGAPLAYRRLACGTECENPANDTLDNYKAGKFADIAGGGPRIRRLCCRFRLVRLNCCQTSCIRDLGCTSAYFRARLLVHGGALLTIACNCRTNRSRIPTIFIAT